MTALLVALVAGAVLLSAAAAFAARRRSRVREARRVEELGRLAERLEASLGTLRPPPRADVSPPLPRAGGAPFVAERLPGRVALLEAVAGEVERARSSGARLTAVLVRVAGDTSPVELADAVREVTERPSYAVGPGAAAFTLPGLGRADGLGALARIESLTASSGRAVEWEPGETAVELVARLLEPRPPGDGG